jgi:hypothetical protein
MSMPSALAAVARLVRGVRAWRGRWAALAILIALIPVAGICSTSSIFVVRDHLMYFWPRYRWLRQTVAQGEWPWWDPYAAGGQSVAGDALMQLFFPPTMLLRLLLPEILAYNLWVALPFPLMALGTYLFARYRLSRRGAGVAAIVFAVSGPVVSTGNFPNMSWSIAALPWVLWATHRLIKTPTARHVVLLAVAVAAQILSGEPVSMVATMALAVGFVIWCLLDLRRAAFAASLRKLALVLAAMAAGAALSAIQILPLFYAASHSARKEADFGLFWSLHPGALVEALSPSLYGDQLEYFVGAFPWMRAVSAGREPFLFSVYVGIIVLAVALVGLGTMRRRQATFWGTTFVVTLLLALGGHTPIYPMLQRLVPLLRSFRYPPKYLVLAMFALAMLAGAGWQTLTAFARRHRALRPRAWLPAIAVAAAFAIVGYGAIFVTLFDPDLLVNVVLRIATALQIKELPLAVASMVGVIEPQGWRLFLLSAATVILIWVAASGRRESHAAAWLLLAAMGADLTVTTAGINRQRPVTELEKPDWVRYVEQHPAERFYFGGRLRGGIDPLDFDSPSGAMLPGMAQSYAVRSFILGQIVPIGSAWQIRDPLTYDLPNLYPIEYERLVTRFDSASRDERLHFLSAAGVRYTVLPDPPRPWLKPLTGVPWFKNMQLYEYDSLATRVRVTPPWGVVEPNVEKALDRLFRSDFDVRRMVVLSEDPPPAAGTPGPPAATSYASLTHDGTTEVDIQAGVGQDGGFLVLADTYDDEWHVDVDGRPAKLLRANGIYRAVRLVPGDHAIRFHYQPRRLLMGAIISGGAFLGLAGLALLTPRRERAISSLPVPLSVASGTPGTEAMR